MEHPAQPLQRVAGPCGLEMWLWSSTVGSQVSHVLSWTWVEPGSFDQEFSWALQWPWQPVQSSLMC